MAVGRLEEEKTWKAALPCGREGVVMVARERDRDAEGRFIGLLLARTQRGDAVASDHFFAWLRARINSLLERQTRGRRAARADVEDATQAACLRVWLHLSDLPSSDVLRRAAVISRRELAKINPRRRGRQKPLLFSELSLEQVETVIVYTEADPARTAQEREQIARVFTAFQALPSHIRDAVWEFFVEGRSLRQCGRSFGVSATTVRRAVTDGRSHMVRNLTLDR